MVRKIFKFIGWICYSILNGIFFVLFQLPGFLLFISLAFVMLIVAILSRLVLTQNIARITKNIALVFDQVANVFIDGLRKKTVSGTLGRRLKEGKATWPEHKLCVFLSWVDPTTDSHCEDTNKYEEDTREY